MAGSSAKTLCKSASLEAYLKNEFERFDQVWLLSYRGDLADNLLDAGIIDHVDVMHVNTPVGGSANLEYLTSEIDLSQGELVALHPDFRELTECALGKVAVLMTKSHKGFEDVLPASFVLTAPTDSYESFIALSDKIEFARNMDGVLTDELSRNKIPWSPVDESMSYKLLRDKFGHAFFLQQAISTGGEGTAKVDSGEIYDHLIAAWKGLLPGGKVKATRGIAYPYCANGSAFIAPRGDSYDLVIDPLSHKPIHTEDLDQAAVFCSIGNDWTQPHTDEVLEQYLSVTKAVADFYFHQFGYTGYLGPDFIVDLETGHLKLNEVNFGLQGTTPYQTLNSQLNGRTPLEFIHYGLKIGGAESLQRFLPAADNEARVSEEGGFYMKFSLPNSTAVVSDNMRGAFRLKSSGKLERVVDVTKAIDVYSSGDLFWLRGPKAGSRVGGEMSPFAYVTGSQKSVFEKDRDARTAFGIKLYEAVSNHFLSDKV